MYSTRIPRPYPPRGGAPMRSLSGQVWFPCSMLVSMAASPARIAIQTGHGRALPMLCPIAPVVWGSEVTGLSALTHRRSGASCAREMWPAVRYGYDQIRFWSSDYHTEAYRKWSDLIRHDLTFAPSTGARAESVSEHRCVCKLTRDCATRAHSDTLT